MKINNMPRIDGKGPDKSGEQIGRGLGKCKKDIAPETNEKLSSGKGLRRKSGGGQGKVNA